MNDRTEKYFTQWLIDIEKEILEGEKERAKLETSHQIFETDEPDPEEDADSDRPQLTKTKLPD